MLLLYFILSYFIVTYFCPAPLSNFVRDALQIPLIDWLIDWVSDWFCRPDILVFPHQTLWQYSDRDLLMGASNVGGVYESQLAVTEGDYYPTSTSASSNLSDQRIECSDILV